VNAIPDKFTFGMINTHMTESQFNKTIIFVKNGMALLIKVLRII